MTIADAADLLRMEYAEMPGLALTSGQAGRLCNLPGGLCECALDILIESGFLKRTVSGYYIKRDTSSPTAANIQRLMREAS